jgi:hypothetical protein
MQTDDKELLKELLSELLIEQDTVTDRTIKIGTAPDRQREELLTEMRDAQARRHIIYEDIVAIFNRISADRDMHHEVIERIRVTFSRWPVSALMKGGEDEGR